MSDLRQQYRQQEEEKLERNFAYAEQGVEFIDINQVYIAEGTEIGAGTVIEIGRASCRERV